MTAGDSCWQGRTSEDYWAFVGPFGQRTELTVDPAGGWLTAANKTPELACYHGAEGQHRAHRSGAAVGPGDLAAAP